MEEERKGIRKSRWFTVIITAIISIGMTVAVAWYQISRSERQAILAEIERARNVRSILVSIVEEHVINEKPIDIIRLARLINSRRREEGVKTPISVLEIFEKAEFNILNSRYLDFQRKQNYKAIFDELYKEYGSREFKPISEGPYSDLVNELAKSIQEGKTSQALEQLRRIAESYQKDIKEIAGKKERQDELVKFFVRLFEKPYYIAVFVLVYSLLLFVFPPYRRMIRRLFGKTSD